MDKLEEIPDVTRVRALRTQYPPQPNRSSHDLYQLSDFAIRVLGQVKRYPLALPSTSVHSLLPLEQG